MASTKARLLKHDFPVHGVIYPWKEITLTRWRFPSAMPEGSLPENLTVPELGASLGKSKSTVWPGAPGVLLRPWQVLSGGP